MDLAAKRLSMLQAGRHPKVSLRDGSSLGLKRKRGNGDSMLGIPFLWVGFPVHNEVAKSHVTKWRGGHVEDEQNLYSVLCVGNSERVEV